MSRTVSIVPMWPTASPSRAAHGLGEGARRSVERVLLVGRVRDRVQEVEVTGLAPAPGGDAAADAAGIPADHVEAIQQVGRQAGPGVEELVHAPRRGRRG